MNLSLLNKTGWKLSGYTLVELMVSMAIIGVLLVMLSNILIDSIYLSERLVARASTREEITNLTAQIVRDVRASSRVIDCVGQDLSARCQLVIDEIITWEACRLDGSDLSEDNFTICKKNSSGQIIYSPSKNLRIRSIRFEEGVDSSNNSTRKNILITVIGDHSNTNLNITNVIRQLSVSTRNYSIN